jgi:hypothetical protein
MYSSFYTPPTPNKKHPPREKCYEDPPLGRYAPPLAFISLLQHSTTSTSHHSPLPSHKFDSSTNNNLPPKKPTSIPNRARDEVPNMMDESKEVK